MAKKTTKIETYTKEALLEHFKDDKLLVFVLLDNDKEYSVKEVEKMIEDWKAREL